MSGYVKTGYVRTGKFSEPDPAYVQRKKEEKIREEQLRQERVRLIRENEKLRDLEASLRRQKELTEEYERKYGKKPSPGARAGPKHPSPPRPQSGPKYPSRPSGWFYNMFGNNKRSRSRSPPRNNPPPVGVNNNKQKVKSSNSGISPFSDEHCQSKGKTPKNNFKGQNAEDNYRKQLLIFSDVNNTKCGDDVPNELLKQNQRDSIKFWKEWKQKNKKQKTGGKSKKHTKKYKRRTIKRHKK